MSLLESGLEKSRVTLAKCEDGDAEWRERDGDQESSK